MDLAVTVHAILAEHAGIARQVAATLGDTDMACSHVTLLAQKRWPGVQQRLVHAAMHLVAGAAILGDGSMLEEHGAALFCVAAVTIIIERRLFELSPGQ